MIHCVSDVYVLTGFTIWPRWSQVHFEILCSVLHLDFWLVLGNIWEDVILVTYLYITALLIKPNEWVLECFFMFACGWKGKSGHLRLWLFSETELRQGHHITMGIMYLGEVVGMDESWSWRFYKLMVLLTIKTTLSIFCILFALGLGNRVEGSCKSSQGKRKVNPSDRRTDVDAYYCPCFSLGWKWIHQIRQGNGLWKALEKEESMV